jgi:hypothetical protein
MKFVRNIFLWGWLAFFFFFGMITLINTPEQMKKDEQFVEWNVKKPVRSIKEYILKHDSLPPQSNYDALIITENANIPRELRGKIDSIPKSGWILGVWRGEWMVYYISWKDEYIVSRWTWGDAITQFLVSSVIGIIPMGIYALIKKVRNYLSKRHPSESMTNLE